MGEVAVEVKLPGQVEPDVLALPVPEGGEAALSNGAKVLDEQLKGRLGRLAEDGELRGELGKTLVLHTDGDLRARHLPAAGIGRGEDLDPHHLRADAPDPQRIDELGMGALAAVGRASANGPRLIVLRYEPSQPARADLTLGLVGKAITFDAGGISLKPALKMEDMKGDM